MSKIKSDKIKEFATILLELRLDPKSQEYKIIMGLINNMSLDDAINYIKTAKNDIEKYKKLYDLAQEIKEFL